MPERFEGSDESCIRANFRDTGRTPGGSHSANTAAVTQVTGTAIVDLLGPSMDAVDHTDTIVQCSDLFPFELLSHGAADIGRRCTL